MSKLQCAVASVTQINIVNCGNFLLIQRFIPLYANYLTYLNEGGNFLICTTSRIPVMPCEIQPIGHAEFS